MKNLLTSILINLAYYFNMIIPKNKDRIIFYSSPDFSDSCRTIYNKLLNNSNSYKFTWVVKDVSHYSFLKNKRTKVVGHKSMSSLWYMCRSKYIFRTHSFWDNKYVQGKQVMCVAWHGMPLKKIAPLTLSKKEKRTCDYFTSTSPFFELELANALGTTVDRIVNTGLPRNDDLFKKIDLKKVFDLKDYNKILIWMPTFRQRKDNSYCDGVQNELGLPLCNKEELDLLNSVLQEKQYYLLIKPHPWAASIIEELSYSNIIVFMDNDLPDSISLYNVIGSTDGLITDYSSVAVDYLLLNRPIAFILDDINEYRNSRGFIVEPIEDYLPGEHIYSFEELLNWILNFEKEDYAEKRDNIKSLFFSYKDANSTERLLSLMNLL